MARITIKDLPVKEDMSQQEAKGVLGGLLPAVRPANTFIALLPYIEQDNIYKSLGPVETHAGPTLRR